MDDGRPLDPDLLASYQLYGQGERALRPALAEAARLNDADCEKQWELPFAVATAEGSEGDARLAWKRALNVEDPLTVVATSPDVQLSEGDRIVRVARTADSKALVLLEALGNAREEGEPFEIALSNGKRVQVRPFQVCRGYTRLSTPLTPKVQDYHWLMTMHPLELPQASPSRDEMLWAVLWTQGLSEEGGARMKTYHYGTKIGGTLLQLVSLASGLNAAALAAKVAVEEAKKIAVQQLADFARDQIIAQARQIALQKIREALREEVGKISRSQALLVLERSARNRGALMGMGWVASTVWERADAWAFERMRRLGADPIAGLRLHQKMVERELGDNAFALDADRLNALTKLAEANGLKNQAIVALGGVSLEDMGLELAAMPMASSRSSFSFSSPDDPGAGRFSRGLIDGMLQLPSASGAVMKK